MDSCGRDSPGWCAKMLVPGRFLDGECDGGATKAELSDLSRTG